MSAFEHPVSIAPMMQRTDRHYRYMMRLITRRTLLYTEMVTANALLHGDRARLLDFSDAEHPVALQLGGDDPAALAECARIAEEWGYDEVNLNVGCPSPRVQNGNFGACLMQTPEVVADCVRAMRAACSIPVTVKHRIGVDDQEDWSSLRTFVATVADAGSERFTVHARKAWLNGLSPRENREIPPLKYDLVWRLKQEFPQLVIEINGGIISLDEVATHLEHVDAVMIGRAAYDDPMLFADVDCRFYGEDEGHEARAGRPRPNRADIALAMAKYAAGRVALGDRLPWISNHLLNLFAGQPGGRHWRRHLSEHACSPGADERVILDALDRVSDVARSIEDVKRGVLLQG